MRAWGPAHSTVNWVTRCSMGLHDALHGHAVVSASDTTVQCKHVHAAQCKHGCAWACNGTLQPQRKHVHAAQCKHGCASDDACRGILQRDALRSNAVVSVADSQHHANMYTHCKASKHGCAWACHGMMRHDAVYGMPWPLLPIPQH
eukprot:1159843-Pelagomonas_calceolata.AAC.7